MIHRFVDLFEIPLPDIPILGLDNSPLQTRTIWQIGNAATPYRMIRPIVSSVGATQTHLGDPDRNPADGASVVYSRFTSSGTITRSVRLVDWADTTDVQLYSDGTGGVGESLQPVWKPDGTKILFRAGSTLTSIKEMNADGTGVTTLYTGAARIHNPLYNHDGTKIGWVENRSVMVANADGTGATAVFTGAVGTRIAESIAWQHAASVVAFWHGAGTDEIWKVMNDDGTGLTTWLTISRVGYGPSEGNQTPIKYSWLESDTGIATTVRQPADPDPDARLTIITSAGSNLISPARYGPANTGNFDYRPVAITGRSEGVERIYWPEGHGIGQPVTVSSVLPDGSDYRIDFDGLGTVGGSVFHGFRGDTLNV